MSCDCDVYAASSEDLGKVEDILKVISRELSVVEIMQVFKGQVAPAERLQPGLYSYIRDKLLNGDTPYTGRMVPAVTAFLANTIPTLQAVEVSVCMCVYVCMYICMWLVVVVILYQTGRPSSPRPQSGLSCDCAPDSVGTPGGSVWIHRAGIH